MSELFSLKDFHVVKFSWYSSVGVIKGEWKGKDEVKKIIIITCRIPETGDKRGFTDYSQARFGMCTLCCGEICCPETNKIHWSSKGSLRDWRVL